MIASSKRTALALTLAACALALPRAALADPPSTPPSEAQVEAARPLYHDARELARQGKREEALAKSMDAYRVAPTPVIALQAAGLLADLGRLVEARDLARVVASLPASPRESDKGRSARQDAATLAASLDARIPKIAIAGRPAGMEVLLDAKATANDAAAWQGVDPGTHTLVVRDGDKTCATLSVTLAEREEKTLDLREPTAACRAAEPSPAASPAPAPPAAPRDATPPLAPVAPAPAPASPDTARWLGAGIGGAGIVAIGVGAVLAVGAKSDYDSVAGECPARGCTRAAYDVRTGARSKADVATGAIALGSAALAAGAVIFFWPRGDHGTGTEVAIGARDVRVTIRF